MKILDVGSGHHPLVQATHLVDKYPNSNAERRGQDLVIGDRIFVKADIECLPFDDNSFDFVNASHVIEHTKNPYRAVSELMRVGKSGYIECPSLLAENLFFGSRNHRFAIVAFMGHISFLKSTRADQRPVPNLFWKGVRACDPLFNVCHSRYYWGDGKALRYRFNIENTGSRLKKIHVFLTFTVGDAFQGLMNFIAHALRRGHVERIKSLLANIEEADGNEGLDCRN